MPNISLEKNWKANILPIADGWRSSSFSQIHWSKINMVLQEELEFA